jgi:hypothetical protein
MEVYANHVNGNKLLAKVRAGESDDYEKAKVIRSRCNAELADGPMYKIRELLFKHHNAPAMQAKFIIASE